MGEAIAYLRCSTAGQVDAMSLPAQRDRISAWAKANDHTIVAWHQDAGIGGSRIDTRPGVQAAVDEACKRRCPLVVLAVARLARSTIHALQLIERLDKAGAGIVSITEAIDTASPAGRLMTRVIAAFGEMEKEIIGLRTKDALAARRARGQRYGEVGYGLRLARDGVRLLSDPEEQRQIAYMRRLRSRGRSYAEIARRLNDRGVPTKKRRGAWASRTVHGVLARDAAERAAAA